MKLKACGLYIHLPVLVLLCLAVFNSCTPAKNIIYFKNLQKDTTLNNVVNNNLELKIRKNDLLSITIISPDPISTPLFNGVPGSSSGNNETALGGYLVDNEGNILVYKIGSIHVEGMTRNELKQLLQRELMPYLRDAVVTVRFLSNRITIIGEVAQPQVIIMPNERLTLLEAIAQSGDIPLTGRKDNILIIRENPTGKQFKRLNLNDNSIFTSPFYYLKPDDIVYVEPSKLKINNTAQTQQILSYILSGISILITIVSLLGR